MPLTLRCHSVNTYCLSKLWFKCGAIELRVGDIRKITSLAKSRIYSDLLINPEERILFKRRSEGGFGLIHIKYRAMAELIKSFIDTAINPKFIRNIYHNALYKWNVEENRNITNPGKSPFYSVEFFNAIKTIRMEHLSLCKLSVGMWYRELMKSHFLTERDENGFIFPILSKLELRNPGVNWEFIWSLVNHSSVESDDNSFAFRLLHNLLSTQENVVKAKGCKESSINCTLCSLEVTGSLIHSLLECPFINDVGAWLIGKLRVVQPNLTKLNLLKLNFEVGGEARNSLPAVWLTLKTLHMVKEESFNHRKYSGKVRSQCDGSQKKQTRSFGRYNPKFDMIP